MNDYNFGNFICYLREQKGYTQADIAKMLDVTPAAVSKWENGESKPRIETLFRLAEILGVRAEELIAGKYLHEESLDPDAVKRINERYEYLRIMDSRSSGSVKLRRILAWIIDWNISGLFSMILTTVVVLIVATVFADANSSVIAISALMAMLSYPVTFILRDLIGKGRSIGKRITGLVILDRYTVAKPKAGKLVLRNILMFIMQVDFIVLLIRGESLGDSLAHTAVVLKREVENREEIQSTPKTTVINGGQEMPLQIERINSYQTPPHAKKRSAVKVVALLVAGFAIFFIVALIGAFIALEGVEETQQYKVAYTYLVNSDTFRELGVDEEQIGLRSYSAKQYPGDDGTRVGDAEFFFYLGEVRGIEIVCHLKDGEWYVCEDCTQLE